MQFLCARCIMVWKKHEKSAQISSSSASRAALHESFPFRHAKIFVEQRTQKQGKSFSQRRVMTTKRHSLMHECWSEPRLTGKVHACVDMQKKTWNATNSSGTETGFVSFTSRTPTRLSFDFCLAIPQHSMLAGWKLIGLHHAVIVWLGSRSNQKLIWWSLKIIWWEWKLNDENDTVGASDSC